MCDYRGCACYYCKRHNDFQMCGYLKPEQGSTSCFHLDCQYFLDKGRKGLFSYIDKIEVWFKSTFSKWQLRFMLTKGFVTDSVFRR